MVARALNMTLPSDPMLLPSMSITRPSSLYCTSSVCVRCRGSPGPRWIVTGPDHVPARNESLCMNSRCTSALLRTGSCAASESPNETRNAKTISLLEIARRRVKAAIEIYMHCLLFCRLILRLCVFPAARDPARYSKEHDADGKKHRDLLPERGHRQVAPEHFGKAVDGRSEERRVGKECRSRWSPYP